MKRAARAGKHEPPDANPSAEAGAARHWPGALVALLCGVLPPLAVLDDGFVHLDDEGFFAYSMLRCALGEVPGVDFAIVYSGLSVWLGGLMLRATGPHFLALRVQAVVLSGVIAVLLWCVTRRLASGPRVWLPSLLFGLVGVRYLWLIPYPSWFGVALGLGSVLCLERSARGRSGWLVLAGLLCGTTLACKQTHGLYQLAACGAWVLLRAPQRAGIGCRGLLVGLLVVAGVASVRFGAGPSHLFLLVPLGALVVRGWRGGADAAPRAWPAQLALLTAGFLAATGGWLAAAVAGRPAGTAARLLARLFLSPAEVFAHLGTPLPLWPDWPFVALAVALGCGFLVARRAPGPVACLFPFALLIGLAAAPGQRGLVYAEVFATRALCYAVPALVLFAAVRVDDARARGWLAVATHAALFYFLTLPVGIPHYHVYALALALPMLAPLLDRLPERRYVTAVLVATALALYLCLAFRMPADQLARSRHAGLRLPAWHAHALDAVVDRLIALPAGQDVISVPRVTPAFLAGRVHRSLHGGCYSDLDLTDRRAVVEQLRRERTAWICFQGRAGRGLDAHQFPELAALVREDYAADATFGEYTLFKRKGQGSR